MILHILTDDQFADHVVRQFSRLENTSDYIMLSHTKVIKYFHYIEKVLVVDPVSASEMENLLLRISQSDAVVFHGLSYRWHEWLLIHMPKHVKVAWFLYGGEIYGQPDLVESFYAPMSKFIYKIRECLRRPVNNYVFPKNLIKRANYCLTSEAEEVDFLNNYLHTNISHLWYTYYALEDTVGPLMNQRCHGNNIILGNSAGIANNHFDALWQLKRIGVDNREIITPLSYGSPWERNLCRKYGKFLFGKRFKPLIEFLPLNEYNAQMLSCSVMIQPHWRPNAHGNIITALWLGMRVYLSERNIEHAFFKRIGCVIFSIEKDLKRSNPKVFTALPDEEVAKNRNILASVFGKQQVYAACVNVVKELCN